ncbi:N-acetylmuramoyl-L-alanine amidase domain protein [Myxococcus xanthus DK 1622]|uniref:N-acetylmuramoyl-L-alanine amidase n=2 Tax=Myxococcus xanthus TaxID=34 RepID=Q1D5K7_MYXXD|nr:MULTISPECIES: N-acetylmuramoyl-L-alanine amidase [Myxococcus]AAO66323.1 N-acetylmuramoyl-L-alanine amidase-like protein [Myxococcus xanthus]ABF86316.1 N-acetylmuramoyl-L-alanine amidase domain protein [Myxococcus xanthus DK 1622]NOJ55119.1 N-acetylmuramoyl-L-alanine amidase [Myxococcus xanthus]QPM76513.1 N-acetylmuramoyl-L-alanine amidase [Myxococcus xanthus]QVW65576.1 N-acetylmuramoyl-L-alanine amidase [Myxococcus xanthus DZ2]
MHSRLVIVLPVLLLLVPSAVGAAKRDEAEEAYQGARKVYYALKDDAARRKLRHHWLNVVARFESVAARFPKSDRAPDALFTAAEMLQELSRISFVEDDLKASITDYTKLLEGYPKHRLSDDGALALAKIHVHRLDQPESARKVLTETLAVNSKGDRAREMRELLASLPSPKAPPPPPRKAAPVVAKSDSSASGKTSTAGKATAMADSGKSSASVDASAKGSVSSKAVASAETSASGKGSAPDDTSSAGTSDTSKAVASTDTSKDAQPAPAVEASGPAERPSSSLVAAIEKMAREPSPRIPQKEPSAPVKEDAREGSLDAAVAAAMASKPAAAEPPRPITRPVDDKVAQARLKAVAKQSRSMELTLAEQLGLKVRRVVIDPGHGGHDTGAIGKGGTREKDVALSISLKLAEELREKGLEVVLTRDDDRFIRLEDRAKYANAEHGDLFISVHCNAAEKRTLRGIETYTLNTSADRYSIRLAARENASSEKGISDLQFILADLATKANTEESTRLATQVQRSLVGGLSRKYKGIRDLGHKEALFYVLLGVKMPAILVETSFLSNPDEEARLKSNVYQTEVAKAIAHGVEEFLGDRRRVAKVD